MANRLVKSLFCAAIAFAPLFTTTAFASFDENAPYLTFHSPSEFSISSVTKRWNGTMEYSTDTINWTTWTGSQITAAQVGDGAQAGDGEYYLYLRGSGNTTVSATSSTASGAWTLTGSNISCEGDIENLREWNGTPSTMAAYCYQQMFMNQAALVKAPRLSATTLANSCYAYMFQGTSITTAPELPVMSLPTYCYLQMFCNCKNLTAAPALPATAINNGCYSAMFSGCSSLVSAPSELPAATLANSCYKQMFQGCAITTAPSLPAMTMVSQCYYSMFESCTNLTAAPALPATTLYEKCYYTMFKGCSSLVTAPTLPATEMKNQCYYHMFENCTSLVSAPDLPATTLYQSCYEAMFKGCTGLKMIPALSATTSKGYCYRYMFQNCSALEISRTGPGTEWMIPSGFSTSSSSLKDMFSGTGGSFTSDPTPGTRYYIQSVPVAPVDPLVQTGEWVYTMAGESANISLGSLISGGTSPYNFVLKSGSFLPSGLSLAEVGGVITGTPSSPSTSSFTAIVTDSASTPQQKEFTFNIRVRGTYNIVYWEDDGSKRVYPLPVIYTYREGEGVDPLPVPTKTAYTFLGWWDAAKPAAGDQVASISTSESGDKALYARWLPDSYSITYKEDNGGNAATLELEPSSYTIEDTVTLPNESQVSKPGFYFAGWYNNTAYSGSPVSTIPAGSTGDKIFYAKWDQAGLPLAPVADANELWGEATVPFAEDLTTTVEGGKKPYTFVLKDAPGNELPEGLEIAGDGHTLSGTVALADTYSFTLTVTDSLSNTIDVEYTLDMSFTKTTDDPLGADAGLNIGFPETLYLSLAIKGGVAPYTFELVPEFGALPSGFVLNGNKIEGTSTMCGNSSFVLRVTDQRGVSSDLDYWMYSQSSSAQQTNTINGIDWSYVYAVQPKKDGRVSIWNADSLASDGKSVIPVTTEGSVHVPDGSCLWTGRDPVTCIGRNAFKGCSRITRVTLPATITDIGENAFDGCTALKAVVIPSSDILEHINTNAFAGATSLEHIYVGKGDKAAFAVLLEASGYAVPNENFILECDFYTLTLDTNLGDELEMPVLTKAYTETIYLPNVGTLPVTTRYNYTFEGWYTEKFGGIRITDTDTLSGGDWTLYAHWSTTLPAPVFTIENNWQGKPVLKGVELNSNTEIVIPDNVQIIDTRALARNAHKSILRRVTIPSSVEEIGIQAFQECERLREVYFEPGETGLSIGSSAFSRCDSLQSFDIPGNVTNIGAHAFAWCSNLVNLTIGPCVQSIGQGAFFHCVSLLGDANDGLYIPDSVESIGDAAFHSVGLEKASLPASLYSEGAPVSAQFTSATILGSVLVTYRTGEPVFVYGPGGSLRSVQLNGNTDIVIPRGVTEIWYDAFRDLSSMTSVEIPDTVKSIRSDAFRGCSGLTEIEIPNSVTNLSYAFRECTGLKRLVVPDSVTALSLHFCSNLEEVVIGRGITAIGDGAFFLCTSLSDVTFLGDVASIDQSAFWGCSSLKGIVLPESLRFIGKFAFIDCTSLETITIPKGVEISEYAFSDCKSLVSAIIGGEVAPLRSRKLRAMASRGNLLAMAQDDETTIGNRAFSGCSSLEEVTIGRTVSDIGGGAFSGCPRLKTISVEAGNSKYSTVDGMLLVMSGETPVELVSAAGDATSLTVPSGVTNILDSAFADYATLASVVLPDTVKAIGEAAFSNATVFTTATIPSSVQSIGGRAFCDSPLAVVYVSADDATRMRGLVAGTGYDAAEVSFLEAGAPTAPTVPGDSGATVSGDLVNGYEVVPSASETTVEVSIPEGVAPKKVTVVVPPTASVKPNGANVKVVKTVEETPYDITEFLDLPVADASGVVELSAATVKEAIVKEVLDPDEDGVVINLTPSSPSITTAATRSGLTYTFREGTTLEGMTQKATKVGDGTSWTPPITVKGGTSGFYSIGVTK